MNDQGQQARFAEAEQKLKARYASQPILKVVTAQPEHYQVLGDLTIRAYEPLMPTMYTDGYVEELADVAGRANQARVFAALLNGHVIGGITYISDGASELHEIDDKSVATIRFLAVDPSSQSLGAGRALVEACLQQALTDNHAAVALHTTERMTAAVALYTTFGFKRKPALDRWWGPVHGLAYRLEM